METVVACNTCGLVQRAEELKPGTVAACFRCGTVISAYKDGNLGRTAAFTLAALILYVPANVYPILRMSYYGAHSESTIWDGCVNLFRHDQWLVAAIVFFASILIPLCKLLGLFWLIVAAKLKSARGRRTRTWVYKIICVIGPWAMLDVFLLAILVALVKFKELATVLPGPGLLAFAAVVVSTILASASFDPKWIWERQDHSA
jgi:paraquat-inducible protein A